MAFPVVEGTAESATTTASTSHVVSLPASIAAGDLLLIIIASVGTGTYSATGWTQGNSQTMPGATMSTAWLYRLADGGEGASVTVTGPNGRSAQIAYRISGAEDPATQAPEDSTTSTSANALLNNPPALSPTGGSKDYLWIVCFGQEGEELDDDTWVNTWNTSFTNPLQKSCGTAGAATSNVQCGSSERQFTGATMTLAGNIQTDQANDSRSYLIAIHPAPAAAPASSPPMLTTYAHPTLRRI